MACEYEVGDSFEGSASQLNRWLSPIWALGGVVEIDGKVATIVSLPGHDEPKEEEVAKDPVKTESQEQVEKATEAKKEVDKAIEDTKEAVSKVEPKPEPPKSKPIATSSISKVTRGRPKKAPEENKEN